MALTGCVGQSFSADLVPKEAVSKLVGPASLAYYGSAFLQSLGVDSAVRRLSVLAEIYRCARQFWPAAVAKVAWRLPVPAISLSPPLRKRVRWGGAVLGADPLRPLGGGWDCAWP